jgi:chemotaxis protein MotB
MLNIKDIFLFESGQAVLKSSSAAILKTLAKSLEQVPPPYRLAIEGHSDDTPIPKGSNFNLSTERALTVYHALLLSEQLKKRVVIMGYGKTSPRVPNKDSESRSQNRRVTLRVF